MRVWPVRILLLLLSGLLLSLVARNAMVQTANNVAAALPFVPNPDDSVQILLRARLLQVDLLKAAHVSGPRSEAAIKNADQADALDFRAFLVAGLIARKDNDLRKAGALLEAARKRQPRNFDIRRLLMETYLIDGRYEDAAREILASTRLNATDTKPLMQALAMFGGDPSARKALSQVLAKRGDWRAKFTTNSAVIELAPSMVFDVANDIVTSKTERQAIVRALATGGKIELAYRLWLKSFSHPAFQPGKFPTDPQFGGWAQSSGFGWKLINSGDGIAEIVKDKQSKAGGLDVEYFGGGAVALVEQPMLLSPGRYRLSAEGRHVEGQEGAGEFRWTINCQEVLDPIAILRIPSAAGSRFSQLSEFIVPAESCPVQILKMTILPGEMDRSMRGVFSNVRITPQ